jgi:hypothetical protein
LAPGKQAVGLAHCGFSIAYSTYNQSSKVRWAGCLCDVIYMVATHGSKPTPIGTLKSIIEGTGLTPDDFRCPTA